MNETILKLVCGVLVAAVLFADKVPTAKKQSDKPFIIFIAAVLIFFYVGVRSGGVVLD